VRGRVLTIDEAFEEPSDDCEAALGRDKLAEVCKCRYLRFERLNDHLAENFQLRKVRERYGFLLQEPRGAVEQFNTRGIVVRI